MEDGNVVERRADTLGKGLDLGGIHVAARTSVKGRRRKRRLVVGTFLGLVVLTVVVVIVVSQQNQRSILPFLNQECVGEVAIRLHNNNLFWAVSYRLLVETGEQTSQQPSGSLAAGDNVDMRFLAVCGPHKVWVSWNNGPWSDEAIVVERGKTYPVYFSY